MGSFYLFLALGFSSVRLLSVSPVNIALFLVLSVLFGCFYFVMTLGGVYWLGYLLSLLFIGGVLVVLLVLTSLSGPSLVLGSTSFVFLLFFCVCGFLSRQSSYYSCCDASSQESLWYFVSPLAWSLGVLGCLTCLLYLVFLGLLTRTSGSLRKLV